jgi:DNA (cytosine-5)-methyltransferase 1
VVTLFSGVGMQETAVTRVFGDAARVVAFAEIDPRTASVFAAIHGISPDLNIGDLSRPGVAEEIVAAASGRVDLLFASPPCQSFSACGLGKGFTEARGNLTVTTVGIVKAVRPRVFILENVAGFASHGGDDYLTTELESDYECHFALLNASSYGIPQNRIRLFGVCVRRDVLAARRDRELVWPPPEKPSGLVVADFLETGDVKRSTRQSAAAIDRASRGTDRRRRALAIKSSPRKIVKIADACDTVGRAASQTDRVYSVRGICPTIVRSASGLVYFSGVGCLTNRECWRLMGMSDAEFDVAAATPGVGASNLKEMAGNGIVVDVAEAVVRVAAPFV